MELQLALSVAKQYCDKTHPATIRSLTISPKLRMILLNNGQYVTSQEINRAKKHWSFEQFAKEFGK